MRRVQRRFFRYRRHGGAQLAMYPPRARSTMLAGLLRIGIALAVVAFAVFSSCSEFRCENQPALRRLPSRRRRADV